MALQVCSKCGTEKPLTEEFWHHNKARSCGFNKSCKACWKITQVENDGEYKVNLLERIEDQGRKLLDKLIEATPLNSSRANRTPHIAEVFQHTMAAFGGAEGYARMLIGTFYAAPAGSATRRSLLDLIARLGTKVSEQGFLERDLKHVSQADLEKLLDQQIRSHTLSITGHVVEDEPPQLNAPATDLRADSA